MWRWVILLLLSLMASSISAMIFKMLMRWTHIMSNEVFRSSNILITVDFAIVFFSPRTFYGLTSNFRVVYCHNRRASTFFVIKSNKCITFILKRFYLQDTSKRRKYVIDHGLVRVRESTTIHSSICW